MHENELTRALEEIEAVLKIQPPIGAAGLPPEIRFFRVLSIIKESICPKLCAIKDVASKPSGELTLLITDCLVATIGHVPLPIATVSKYLIALGVQRFCDDPTQFFAQK